MVRIVFRYTRVKQDNAALTARIHMLEEHIRELEVLYLYLVCICICIYLSLYLYLYLNQCTTSNSWLFQVRGEGAVKAAEVAKSRMVTSALILHQLSKLVNSTLSRWKQIPPTLKL